jgi:hypothetical protein
MLAAARIISGLFVVTFGFAWTVGQAGLETTNRNLCELVTAVWHRPFVDCQFATWIVWLWGIGTIVAVAFLIFDGVRWIFKRIAKASVELSPETESNLSSHFPDIRVADSPNTLALFDGKENIKLIPLLERERIMAWGRPRGIGEPPPLSIPGDTWRTHQLDFHPHRDVPGMRNQTFLKRKGTGETAYYDVLLNRQQLRQVWPNFEPEYETRKEKSSASAAVEWNFDATGPFIGMTAEPDDQIRIFNFQARGWNRTGDPITKIGGYVRSDKTNRRYPIKINDGHGTMIEPHRVRLIPVDQSFDIAAPFGTASRVITVREFVNEIVPFTFFFEYDGKEFRRTFTWEQIEPRLRAYEQVIRQSFKQATEIKVSSDPNESGNT